MQIHWKSILQSDPNVIYLGPGLYQQDYTVPSGKTLYIAGGAVVKGSIILDSATNAKVIGRGVLDRPSGRAISIDYSNQITVDGIIVINYGSADGGGCAINAGNSSNVVINNFKAYGSNKWGDGIDLFASKNVTINDVYIRSHDDSVAVYNARANGGRIWYGDSQDIAVSNSILQPDFCPSHQYRDSWLYMGAWRRANDRKCYFLQSGPLGLQWWTAGTVHFRGW